MSEVSLQVEGKGNGIKTVIANMSEVAKALQRPPTCKYSTGTLGQYMYKITQREHVVLENDCWSS